MGVGKADYQPIPTYVQGILLLSLDRLYFLCLLNQGGLQHETARPSTLVFDDYHDF